MARVLIAPLAPKQRWLGGLVGVDVRDEASVSEARGHVRAAADAVGLPEVARERLVTATSELAHNHLRHAVRGVIAARPVERAGVRGLEVVAADEGPGIADPTQALRRGASSSGGLGVGFASVFSLADEVDVDVRLGEGTCVWARCFASPGARRREVAVFGRAIEGESLSGDDAGFARAPDGTLTLALADGLGHGPEARAASAPAIEEALAHVARDLVSVLGAAHTALRGTRGAVMTLARVAVDGAATFAGVGNAAASILARGASRQLAGQAGFLGQPARLRTSAETRAELAPRTVLALFSDGLSGKLGLAGADDDLLFEAPIVIAQALLTRHGRSHDDALVLVVAERAL